MRKFVPIIVLLLSYSFGFAQERERFFSPRANSDLPLVAEGMEQDLFFNKKGTKGLTISVLSVEYSDSTFNGCNAKAVLRFEAKGRSFELSVWRDEPEGEWYLVHYPYGDVVTINENEYVDIPCSYHLSVLNGMNLAVRQGAKHTQFAYIPMYDSAEYSAKVDALNEKYRQEQERIAAEMRAKEDSVRNAYREKQNLLLTPEYLANWVGASFFTKESIENDCNVRPAAYNGGSIFYDFSKCPVTMTFDEASNVCTEISFRLFGEDGYQMKRDLIDYGYKLIKKTTGDLIIENNFYDVQTGTTSIYKYKLKQGGYSTCRITEGQAMMFTFYRTKN